jgi:hypothetical protein
MGWGSGDASLTGFSRATRLQPGQIAYPLGRRLTP